MKTIRDIIGILLVLFGAQIMTKSGRKDFYVRIKSKLDKSIDTVRKE